MIRYDDTDPDVRAGVGGLICVDLTKPYDYAWRGMGSAFCLSVPAEQVGLPAHVVRTASRQLRTSPLYALFQRHLLSLARDTDAIVTDATAPAVASASIELLRALLASAAHDSRFDRSTVAAALLVQVRAYVQQHLREPDLTPATIARAHSISQRHLFRVCAAADFSLEQWIIGRRLVGAHEDLARASDVTVPISSIARRWGFRDPAHFTRRFKATYGLTPRDWRRVALSEPSGA